MSDRLRRHRDFLTLLLTTDKQQADILPKHLTKEQVNVLSEVSMNLDSFVPMEPKSVPGKQAIFLGDCKSEKKSRGAPQASEEQTPRIS